MYENRHARFTAVDPLLASGKSANPQTFNRYVYVLNSPLVFTDPTGLQTNSDPTINLEPICNANCPYSQTSNTEVNKNEAWTVEISMSDYVEELVVEPASQAFRQLLDYLSNADPWANRSWSNFETQRDAAGGSPEAMNDLNMRLIGNRSFTATALIDQANTNYEFAYFVGDVGLTLQGLNSTFNPVFLGMVGGNPGLVTNRGFSIPRGNAPGFGSVGETRTTWNQFQTQTAGQFNSRRAAADAWQTFKLENGIANSSFTRSSAARGQFLRGAASSGEYPRFMNQWLQQGRVPPGYQVDHIKPLSIGGDDLPSNMRLLDIGLHRIHHKFYRPWE